MVIRRFPKVNKKIVLLVGGASAERPVSKMSAKAVYEALIRLGNQVTLIDPAYGSTQPNKTEMFFDTSDFMEISKENYLSAFILPVFKEAEVVFIGLHGKWGEDGTVQSILELMGIPYTGSGVRAASMAMDKGVSKILMRDEGVTVPEGFVVYGSAFDVLSIHKKITTEIGYPTIVKPNDEGSTIGLSIVQGFDELEQALNESAKFSHATLVEQFIPGRELTVGILADEVLPVLEIVPKKGIYDYESKYTKGFSEYFVPADLESGLTQELKRQSLLAYNAIGCKNYARVDFRLSPEGKPYCLELNPLPGMTETSLLPKMAAAQGITFDELVKRIVLYGIEFAKIK